MLNLISDLSSLINSQDPKIAFKDVLRNILNTDVKLSVQNYKTKELKKEI